MDEHYDMKTAMNAVEAISKERRENPNAGPQLAGIVKEDGSTILRVIRQQNPTVWQLMYDESDAQPVEAVLSVQGIISLKDLPPFEEKHKYVQKRAQHLKQSISLTGLGSPTFDEAVNSATWIFGLFSRYVPQNKLQKWNPSEYDDHSSLDMGNRIFTQRKDNPKSPHIPFGSDIDPEGKLAGLMGTELFYGEDNRVQYMGKTTGAEGEVRYTSIPPVTFRTGDIVEAKISFIVKPVRGGEFKMLTVLRALTLVDANHSQRAFLSRMGRPTNPRILVLKRKVGYEEEEAADTRARLDKMRSEREQAFEAQVQNKEAQEAQMRIDDEGAQEVQMVSEDPTPTVTP